MNRTIVVALMLVLAGTQTLHAGNNLTQAASSGNMQAVRQSVIIDLEGVDDIDKWGWAALLWAVYYGHLPVVKRLLNYNADPNIRSVMDYRSFQRGTTALILAAYYGRDEVIEALLKEKADPSVVDKNGKKAIDYAREYRFEKCVTLLEEKK